MVERKGSFQRPDGCPPIYRYLPSCIPGPLQICQVDCQTIHRLPTDRNAYPENMVQWDLPIRYQQVYFPNPSQCCEYQNGSNSVDSSTLRWGRGVATPDVVPSLDVPRVLDCWVEELPGSNRKEPYRQCRFEDK